MELATPPPQPARRADYLGWFVGLVVGLSVIFGLALLCVFALKWGHPWPPDFTWADNLALAAWALQAPLAFWGLVSTVQAAWRRRFGRAVLWLLFTVWTLLVLVGGSVVLAIVVFGGAPSVGEPSPDSPEGREMARLDSLYSSPAFQEKLRKE